MAGTAGTVPALVKSGRNDLALRALSAAILAPLALLIVYVGMPWYGFLIGAGGVVLAWEWARMCGGGRLRILGGMLPIHVLAVMSAAIFFDFEIGVIIALWGAAVLVWLLGYFFKAMTHPAPIWLLTGGMYIELAGISLLWLRVDPEIGRELVLWLLTVVWAADIFAYLVGRTAGGPLLAPRISPKKTWSGAAGGLLGAAGVSLLVGGWGGLSGWPQLATFGVAVGIVAILGDLLESFCKRRFAVKDSGALIPGHGGLFDRVDALLAASLIVAAWQVMAFHLELNWR